MVDLPERMRQAMDKEGFEGSKSSLDLRHHTLERRDVGYAAFMQFILSPEDWAPVDWAFEQQSQHANSLL